jgi:glutamate 5-kinase
MVGKQASAAQIRTRLHQAKRVVVKAGSNVVLDAEGYPSLGRLFGLIESLAALRRSGRDVILVSSGAVGLGVKRLGMGARPTTLGGTQACAAVGQGELMGIYQSGFGRMGAVCAQVLLTEDDFAVVERRRNLQTTLTKLLEFGVIPVINENDTVCTQELERVRGGRRIFGDNDKLSALVSVGLEADLLVILSDVDGLHLANPKTNPGAPVVPSVAAITPEIEALALGAGSRGRGGMATKLEAAKVATHAGIHVVIAPGERAGVVDQVMAGKEVGTLFLAGARPDGNQLEHLLGKSRIMNP